MSVKVYQLRGQVVWSPPPPDPSPTRVGSAYQLVAYPEAGAGTGAYSMHQLVARITFTYGNTKTSQAYQLAAYLESPKQLPQLLQSSLAKSLLVENGLGDPLYIISNQKQISLNRSVIFDLEMDDPSGISNNYRNYSS